MEEGDFEVDEEEEEEEEEEVEEEAMASALEGSFATESALALFRLPFLDDSLASDRVLFLDIFLIRD